VEPVEATICIPILDDDVLALDPPEVAELLPDASTKRGGEVTEVPAR
jgi:hypothetical protein